MFDPSASALGLVQPGSRESNGIRLSAKRKKRRELAGTCTLCLLIGLDIETFR